MNTASAKQSTETPLPPPPTGIHRVIVISLDGARPDAILQTDTPVLHRLAEAGAVDWNAQTINPSVTLPAHTSMLTGLSAAEHGVDYNSTPRDAAGNCIPIDAPTFITTAADAGMTTAMVVGKEKFCIFRQRESVDYTFALLGDLSVAARVVDLLHSDTPPQVIFAHFPNPDYFGHLNGWMSDSYLYEWRNTDAQIGRIVDTLDELNLRDETLVIITADHGGHEMGHGTTLPVDMTIPWIAYGAGVAPGTTLEGVGVADTAPTVLWALGLPLPQTSADADSSHPITEAFALGGQ